MGQEATLDKMALRGYREQRVKKENKDLYVNVYQVRRVSLV